MNRENLLILLLPFILSAGIIFGHYGYLSRSNPQAHERPLIDFTRIQRPKPSELTPISPEVSLPSSITGITQEVSTSNQQLEQLLTLIKSQKDSVLVIEISYTISADGNIILTQAADSSQDTLLMWAKKTSSEAHKAGIHTYLAFILDKDAANVDVDRYEIQLHDLFNIWANFAQEYHITFFDPGIMLGHKSFANISLERMQLLQIRTERKLRELYTGRLGIQMCCNSTQIPTKGYNQILVISPTGLESQNFLNQVVSHASNLSIEHVFLLNQDTQSFSTLK